jgi:hypothetical protein
MRGRQLQRRQTRADCHATVVLLLLQECTDRISRTLIEVADGSATGRSIVTQANDGQHPV